MSKTIVLASDHNGVELKSIIKSHLLKSGHVPIDLGPYTNDRSVDYVDYATQVAKIVAAKDVNKGILICGTGVGMSIAANRVSGVRAALVHNEFTSPKTREHNDSNVLCLGAWVADTSTNIAITELWLNEPYAEGRHNKRLAKIDVAPGLVVTNGVFDVLHHGHIELLKFSKSCGDKLIVAIDSDERVKMLKGDDRPVNKENFRRELLRNFRHVDDVIVFNSEEELRQIVEQLKPEVLVKGGEWTAEQVRERDQVPACTKVITFPFIDGYSTTLQIKKIREMTTHEKSPGSR